MEYQKKEEIYSILMDYVPHDREHDSAVDKIEALLEGENSKPSPGDVVTFNRMIVSPERWSKFSISEAFGYLGENGIIVAVDIDEVYRVRFPSGKEYYLIEEEILEIPEPFSEEYLPGMYWGVCVPEEDDNLTLVFRSRHLKQAYSFYRWLVEEDRVTVQSGNLPVITLYEVEDDGTSRAVADLDLL